MVAAIAASGDAMRVTGQGQREVVILHTDAQWCTDVQIADLVNAR